MRTRYLIIVALLLGSGCQAENALADRDVVCHLGAYQLADGEVIDINPTSTQGTLRWHRVDGRTGTLRQEGNVWRGRVGWTQRDDPTEVRLGTCGTGRVFFGGKAGNKVPFAVSDTRFRGAAGVQLRGRLVMPEGDETVPLVVLVHGSEEYSGVDYYHAQHLFPAHGIGVFVYDKRGTGQSGGRYTQDFDVLANDAVAALDEARRLANGRVARIGYRGSSQGGWVAPLAATRSNVDFVQVAYGLAESPAAEDREQVMQELRSAGYGPDVLGKAREVTDATAAMMAEPSWAAAKALAAVRRKYRDAPWWPAMRGEFTGKLLQHPPWLSRLVLPWMDRGTPWNHDAMAVLRKVEVPQLWMIAAEDRDAPPAETLRRLEQLAGEGFPVTTALFPDTDHGLVEFEEGPGGTRDRTRYADGYLRMSIDFIRDGQLDAGRYGRAMLRLPASPEVFDPAHPVLLQRRRQAAECL